LRRHAADPRAKKTLALFARAEPNTATDELGRPPAVLAPPTPRDVRRLRLVRHTAAGELVRILSSCLCSCLIDEAAANEPDVLAKHRTIPRLPIRDARWGPGRHLAGTAARSVHRVRS